MVAQITYHKLKQIKLTGLNPRKQFDDASISELAESIKQVGILSPLICRSIVKSKGQVELVCGERRFKAAQLAGLDEVPVILRELTDDEALDLMITENLQRKDVSPMEEAQAFLNLLEKRSYDILMLVSRFGKSETFIRMRLKLNDLIEPLRELLDKEIIGIGHAMEICKLDGKIQQELYEDKYEDREGWWEAPTLKKLKSYILSNFMLNLSGATFSLDDNTLDEKAGTCISCIKNTACNMLLFPDSPAEGVCTDRSCFKNKSAIQFDRELKRIQEQDPDIIIGYPSHIYGDDEKQAKALIKQGVPAIELGYHSGYIEVSAPEPPEVLDRDDYEDEEEYQEGLKDFETELEEYANDLQEYSEKIKGSNLLKTFIIAGNDKGKILYYERTGNENTGPRESSLSESEFASVQIATLKEKDKRNAELAFEKTYFKVKELISEKNYTMDMDPLTNAEHHAIFTIMIENIDDDLGYELYGKKKSWYDNNLKYPACLNLTQLQKNRIMRNFIKRQLDNGTPVSQESEAKALIEVARQHFPAETKTIELEQQGVYMRRREGIEKKIALLKESI